MSDSAPVPVDAQAALNALSPEARSSWELTGEWPKDDAPTSEPAAEPAAEPEADSDEPDEAPAAEPPPAAAAKPTLEKPVSKRQQHINDLMRKATEAELKAAQLEQRLADLEKPKPAAEPAPIAAAPDPAVDPTDPEPQEEQFETYKAFTLAAAKWAIRQAKREDAIAAEREAKSTQERETADAQRSRLATWIERRDAFAATHPDFRSKAGPFLDRVRPGTPIGDTLLDSPVGPDVAWHLVEHPQVLDRIAQLGPIQQLRALGKLEALFESDSDESPRTSASAGPAAKHVTTAPAPPTTLAARSADHADASVAAVARGDFRAFEAEENRRAARASR